MTTGGSTRETMEVARAAGAQVVGGGGDRQPQRRHRVARRAAPRAARAGAADLRARTPARCARRSVPVAEAGLAAGGAWPHDQMSRLAARAASPSMPHAEDHARVRRHRLRRLAAAGRGRVDPGAARRGAGRDRRAARSTVIGAGRTDAGVHALGQVASCHDRPPAARGTLVARAQRDAARRRPRPAGRGRRRGVPRALFRALEDLPVPACSTATSSARSSAGTSGTCRARSTSTRWPRRRGCSRATRLRGVPGRRQRDAGRPSGRSCVARASGRCATAEAFGAGVRAGTGPPAARPASSFEIDRRRLPAPHGARTRSGRWSRSGAAGARRGAGWPTCWRRATATEAGPTAPASRAVPGAVDYDSTRQSSPGLPRTGGAVPSGLLRPMPACKIRVCLRRNRYVA